MKTIFIIAALLLFCTIAAGQDVNDLIEEIQDKYDEMQNFSATFKQVETFKITGSHTESIGKVYISKGERYRFESDEQVIVTDGKSVWAYSARSSQVIVDRVRENSSALLPRDILFKYPKKFYATLLSTEKQNDDKIYLIKLDPKEDTHGYIQSVKIWVQDESWLILKIETTDLRGNQTAFEITNINIKNQIPESMFKYTPAADTEVVDRR